MTSQTINRKIWIGRWLILVALLHTLFAIVVFGKVFLDIVQRGVFDTVGNDPMTAAAVWFLLFGAVLALMGMAIHSLEQNNNFTSARALGVGTLLLSLIGILLMPASGFWLALPAAFALMRKKPE
ncbi:MAG: DUF6463 family protein [Burkholderiales bacterium]|nr:DUF6463 family protein [Burkholderiales bacterium]